MAEIVLFWEGNWFPTFFWFLCRHLFGSNCSNQRLTETQSHSGWKTSLEATLAKALIREGPNQSGCSGLFSVQLQIFPKMQIPQPLWALVPVLDWNIIRKLFLIHSGNFLSSNFHLLPLALSLCNFNKRQGLTHVQLVQQDLQVLLCRTVFYLASSLSYRIKLFQP